MIWMAKVPWRHAATAYLWERVCVCINFLLYSLCWGMCLHTLSTFCRPSAVTLCPCVRLCVYSALWGTWPILLLFLDNGCIYILILDYLAEFDEGFFVSTVHADSRPEAEHENHCHLYAFSPHFCAANLRHQQTQRHRNWAGEWIAFSLSSLYTKWYISCVFMQRTMLSLTASYITRIFDEHTNWQWLHLHQLKATFTLKL